MYSGEWHSGLRQGEGTETFQQSQGDYTYSGTWHEGRKSLYPNQITLHSDTPLDYELAGPPLDIVLHFQFKGDE